MALSFIRLCGRVLFLILLLIQNVISFWLYTSMFFNKKMYTVFFLAGCAAVVIVIYPLEVMLGDLRRRSHLSYFFRGWQFYINIVIVPSIICAFGVQASLAETVLRRHLVDMIKVPFCITPILLILLLTTANDSSSSKSHKELVRNLSVLMVADLFDAIEMLNNAFESSSEAFDHYSHCLVIANG